MEGVLKNNGLGSLEQISKMLWDEMNKEIQRNGFSDLTLNLEGAVRGIQEILTINHVVEERVEGNIEKQEVAGVKAEIDSINHYAEEG